MTHDPEPEDDIARIFFPADGWEIVARVLARIALTFGARDTLARRRLSGDAMRALLALLRPVELLARKLLFAMACALAPAPLRARGAQEKQASPPPLATTDPGPWRVSFRLCAANDATKRALTHADARTRVFTTKNFDGDDWRPYREARATPDARDAAVAPQPRASHREPCENLAAANPRFDGRILAQRIEALLRLAADPALRARRLSRHLRDAAKDTQAARIAAFCKPHDRRNAGACPAGLALADRLVAHAARRAFDTS